MNQSINTDLLKNIPSLKQKFLVDLVNGIDVSHDHIKIQNDQSGFMARMWSVYTGEDHKRQTNINELLVTGLESSLQWMSKLTNEITLTNNALTQVNNGLNKVKTDLACVANYAADTKEQLDRLQKSVDVRFATLEAEIKEVDLRQRAYQQIDALFTSWTAGDFIALSLAQRCFLVVTDLAWGEFSHYCEIARTQDREKIVKFLHDGLITQISADAKTERGIRVNSDIWLTEKTSQDMHVLQYKEAVMYLGNHISPQAQPFTWYALNKKNTENERPACVPYLMDASRLVKGMENDLLKEGYLYAN